MRKALTVLLLAALCATEARAQQPRWHPAAGEARYLFTGTEQSANRTSVIEVAVVTRSTASGPATLELIAARSGSSAAALSPIVVDPSCRREFGGDESVIGRVVVRDGLDPHSAVPQCIPEDLFGAVTDLIAMMLVQHPAFGIDRLRAAGDSARFGPFEAQWSRQSPVMQARVAAPGGTIRLAELTADRAVVHWRPDSMDLSIARKIAPGQTVVLHGSERFALELTIDPATGVLLGARSLEDIMDLTMWMVQGEALPPLTPLKTPGAPVAIRRTLQLERAR